MSSIEQRQSAQSGVRYSSKLMTALNRFTAGLATEVANPLKAKYGKAYEHLITGDTFRYREEIETAISHYQLALECRDDFTEAYLGMAKCYRRKGDVQSAIEYLSKGLAQNAFRKDLHLDMAKCYAETGFTTKSTYHYERVIKLDRKNIEARFGLALLVETSDDLDTAIRLYQEIIEIENDFLPAYNNLGSLYMRVGRYADAETLFRTLVSKAPEFSRGHLGLAITLDKAGKFREALDCYQLVLRMRPTTKNADFIEKRIISLNKDLGRTKTRKNLTLVLVK